MNAKPVMKDAELALGLENESTPELTAQELEWIGGGEAVVNTI